MGIIAEKQEQYAEELKYYEESLRIFREIGWQLGIMANLLNIGSLHAKLQHVDRAWKYLRAALQEACASHAVPPMLFTLIEVAQLYAQTGQPARAVELLGLVLAHPTADAEVEQEAAPVLAHLRAALPAPELEAARTRGRTRELAAVKLYFHKGG